MSELKPLPTTEGPCGVFDPLCKPFEALCFPCAGCMDRDVCGLTLRQRVIVMGAILGLYQCADGAYDALIASNSAEQPAILWVNEACLIASYFAGAWSVYNHDGAGSRPVLRFAWFVYGLTFATFAYQAFDVRGTLQPIAVTAYRSHFSDAHTAGVKVVR